MSTKKPTDKVVSLCGRPIDITKVDDPPAVLEARRAKEQLAHWGPQTARYVALFVLDDGNLAFCGSPHTPAETLQLASTLVRFAQDMAHIELTGEAPVYDAYELEEGDE